MNIDEAIKVIEQSLLGRSLTPVERFILYQSWRGQTYSNMARDSAYCSAHVKEIGSRLWQELSDVVGQKVTKKNLHLIWQQYQKNRELRPTRPIAPSRVEKKDERLEAIASLKFPSGPVPLDSSLYINRPPIEDLIYAELNQPGCVVCIKAPRKMGKTSLLNRTLARSQEQDYSIVFLDFQEADSSIFVSLDKFLRWFCLNISRQLNLIAKLDDYWDEAMGSKTSCKLYFQEYLLKQIHRPLVLAMNEVDRVFAYPKIAQDFLPMLRLWHELARVEQVWQKLRLVVVHTTEIYVPLKLNQSPFNVGLSLRLPQFNFDQVQDLAQRYGLDGDDDSSIQQLMAMVGGHPYLVNVAFYHLCRGDMTLAELLQAAPTLAGIYGYHLRGHLEVLRQDAQLVSALQRVVMTSEPMELDAIAAYKLESMGLIHLHGNLAQPSCELYRLYFRKQLFQIDESSVPSWFGSQFTEARLKESYLHQSDR